MRYTLAPLVALLVCSGCMAAFERRKDPDLLQVKPGDVHSLKAVLSLPSTGGSVSDRSTWQIHSSLNKSRNLIDGDLKTIAHSDDDHRLGEWILIDLGCVCHFQSVQQIHPGAEGHPPSYRVDTADERGFPFALQCVTAGQPGISEAALPRPVHARFIRITLIEDSPNPWRVAEIELH
jgi:hypothetical protein